MPKIRIALVLIALLALVAACNSGTNPKNKAVSDKKPATANTEKAPPSVTKPMNFSLDTGRQVNQPISETKQPPLPYSAPKTKSPGPPGYITRTNVLLQTEPAPNAATVAPLKQYENVYILETLFTNDQGQQSDYPTWYKVERENKQQGWVKGGVIGFGG